MPDMRERVARRSARSGHAVPDGRVSAQRRRVTHEGTPDARAVRRVWSGPAPLLLRANGALRRALRSEEHTSELQSQSNLVCRLLLEKKKQANIQQVHRPVNRQRTRARACAA